MSAAKRFHIVLRAGPHSKALFIAVMQSIAAAMLAHASTFVTPPVDLNTFSKQVADLVSDHQQARARVPGAVELRDQALGIVSSSVELLRAYVEQLCNASPEQAATLAQAASMHLSSTPVRAKVPLRAKQGAQPGVVILYASASLLVTGKGGRYFCWEYSIDGGATWVVAPSTPGAKTTLSGLPVLKECNFRVAVNQTKTGQGPWSAPVPFLVH